MPIYSIRESSRNKSAIQILSPIHVEQGGLNMGDVAYDAFGIDPETLLAVYK